MQNVLALSVRQPWAYAIIHLGKDLENRSRRLTHRGVTLIHASLGMSADEYENALRFMKSRGLPFEDVPPPDKLPRGGIVGAVNVVDAVNDHASDWWMGPSALVLCEARPVSFIECKGTVAPLFWRPPADVLNRAQQALGGF